MWLCNSSIGRKVVMSVTGIALVLFLTFHGCMNVVALISAEGYNMICEFLGANWYAVAATAALAALTVIHIVYAFWLTIQNRKARGNNRYEVTEKPKKVEWASQNMLVLGIIVVLGLALHLVHFWSKMQLVEILHSGAAIETINGAEASIHPANGALLMAFTFSKWYNVVLYLVWFAALWFHLNHGVWSMFQTVGWANDTWLPRLKCIAKLVSGLIFLGFAVVAVVFYAKSLCCGCC